MKKFKYLEEDVNLSANVQSGKVGLDLSAVRDNINAYLNGVTSCTFVTPYIALERVSKVLANYHIFLPKYTFMEGDSGLAVFNINQFGSKVGMNDDGEVVTSDDSPFSFYFEYNMNDKGTFDVFAEIVDEDELQELMGDLEDEFDDEDEELNEEGQLARTRTGQFIPGTGEQPRQLERLKTGPRAWTGQDNFGARYPGQGTTGTGPQPDISSGATPRSSTTSISTPTTSTTAKPSAPTTTSTATGASSGAGRSLARGLGVAGIAADTAMTAAERAKKGQTASQVATGTASQVAGGAGGGYAGAKVGAALGALGGPAAPVTVPLGAIAGGVAGYMAGSSLAGKAHDTVRGIGQEKKKDDFEGNLDPDVKKQKVDTDAAFSASDPKPSPQAAASALKSTTPNKIQPAAPKAAPQAAAPKAAPAPKAETPKAQNPFDKYGANEPDAPASAFFRADKEAREMGLFKENVVAEGRADNKAKKREALKQAYGQKKLRDIRAEIKGKISDFDPRDLKKVSEQNIQMQNMPYRAPQPGQPSPYTMQNMPYRAPQPGQPSPYTMHKGPAKISPEASERLRQMSQQPQQPQVDEEACLSGPETGSRPTPGANPTMITTGVTIPNKLMKKSKIDEEKMNRILEACWKGYRKKGMKTMFGKRYPNCVKDD